MGYAVPFQEVYIFYFVCMGKCVMFYACPSVAGNPLLHAYSTVGDSLDFCSASSLSTKCLKKQRVCEYEIPLCLEFLGDLYCPTSLHSAVYCSLQYWLFFSYSLYDNWCFSLPFSVFFSILERSCPWALGYLVSLHICFVIGWRKFINSWFGSLSCFFSLFWKWHRCPAFHILTISKTHPTSFYMTPVGILPTPLHWKSKS